LRCASIFLFFVGDCAANHCVERVASDFVGNRGECPLLGLLERGEREAEVLREIRPHPLPGRLAPRGLDEARGIVARTFAVRSRDASAAQLRRVAACAI
jgi:hypothetical protein